MLELIKSTKNDLKAQTQLRREALIHRNAFRYVVYRISGEIAGTILRGEEMEVKVAVRRESESESCVSK